MDRRGSRKIQWPVKNSKHRCLSSSSGWWGGGRCRRGRSGTVIVNIVVASLAVVAGAVVLLVSPESLQVLETYIARMAVSQPFFIRIQTFIVRGNRLRGLLLR